MKINYCNIILAIIFGAALVACAIYLREIAQISYNFPNEDDFNAVLGFLNSFLIADYPRKIYLLFSQHVDHRLVLTHIFALLDYQLFGVVNFNHLIWIGNLGWFLVIIYFYRNFVH